MIIAYRTFVLCGVLVGLGLGCGENRPPNNQDEVHYILNAWSQINHQVYPGETVTLQVVVLKWIGTELTDPSQVQVAAGETVAWSIAGTPPPGAELSHAAISTDPQGLAAVTLEVGMPTRRTSYQVAATTTGTDPVAFSIDVQQDQRHLELLTNTPLDTVINRTERLRVRLVRGASGSVGGPAIADEPIVVRFAGGSNGAGLEPGGSETTVTTDTAGVAAVRFATGTAQHSGYQVTFCPGTTCPGVNQLTIQIDVGTMAAGTCRYFTDCPSGQVCYFDCEDDVECSGECVEPGAYCGGTQDCPLGYECDTVDRRCVEKEAVPCSTANPCEGDDVCVDGYCVPPDGCVLLDNCEGGFTCDPQLGICIPPITENAIDVSGLWETTYHFDISDTLPNFFTGGLGPVVDFLNLLFESQIEIPLPYVGDVIEALIDEVIAEYVPPWVGTIVGVLADFIHLFENMEARGTMMLTQAGTPPNFGPDVAGEEQWTSAQFYVVSFCPGGPAEFERDPSCGRIDVLLDPSLPVVGSNEELVVGAKVGPFTGRVMGYTLNLYGRDVRINFSQLINVLLDIIVLNASSGSATDFEEFLEGAMPCEDLQVAMDDMICDLSGGDICQLPGVEAACQAAAGDAVDALHGALGEISLNALKLDFEARAAIHDNTPLDERGDVLGSATNPSAPAECAIIGTCSSTVFEGSLGGSWWYAVRPD